MALERDIEKLLELRAALNAADAAYDAQRSRVYDMMRVEGVDAIEQDGWRITAVDRRKVRRVDHDLLVERLQAAGLSPDVIHRILDEARTETEYPGMLRVSEVGRE